mmetsp:Transcript_23145/g.31652  ORF Transcript_23145/g.31652 Transcript_23145/m.31652 type:complete len:202 (-) Transcript_23145:2692-3297(-)
MEGGWLLMCSLRNPFQALSLKTLRGGCVPIRAFHPEECFEVAAHLFHKLPEVHARVGMVEERQSLFIELEFGVVDSHGKVHLASEATTEFNGLLLLNLFQTEALHVLRCGDANRGLKFVGVSSGLRPKEANNGAKILSRAALDPDSEWAPVECTVERERTINPKALLTATLEAHEDSSRRRRGAEVCCRHLHCARCYCALG